MNTKSQNRIHKSTLDRGHVLRSVTRCTENFGARLSPNWRTIHCRLAASTNSMPSELPPISVGCYLLYLQLQNVPHGDEHGVINMKKSHA
jgi:hypothetical protein